MLAHLLGCWANTEPPLGQRLTFLGLVCRLLSGDGSWDSIIKPSKTHSGNKPRSIIRYDKNEMNGVLGPLCAHIG